MTTLIKTLIALLVLTPTVSFAQEAPKPTLRQTLEKRAEMIRLKGSGEEVRPEQAELRMLEARKSAADTSKERIGSYVQKLMERLEAATERLTNIADRLQSRIEKLEEKDLDMSEAKALLATAREKIAEADASIDTLPSYLERVLSAEYPKEAFGELKNELKEVDQAVKQAHHALVEAIAAVRASAGDAADTETEETETEAEIE